jgi:hypothetical protein
MGIKEGHQTSRGLSSPLERVARFIIPLQDRNRRFDPSQQALKGLRLEYPVTLRGD